MAQKLRDMTFADLIDNPYTYCIGLAVICGVCFVVALLIGMVIWK